MTVTSKKISLSTGTWSTAALLGVLLVPAALATLRKACDAACWAIKLLVEAGTIQRASGQITYTPSPLQEFSATHPSLELLWD